MTEPGSALTPGGAGDAAAVVRKGALSGAVVIALIYGALDGWMLAGKEPHALPADWIATKQHTVLGSAVTLPVSLPSAVGGATYRSNGKILFQSSFMLTTSHPCLLAFAARSRYSSDAFSTYSSKKGMPTTPFSGVFTYCPLILKSWTGFSPALPERAPFVTLSNMARSSGSMSGNHVGSPYV